MSRRHYVLTIAIALAQASRAWCGVASDVTMPRPSWTSRELQQFASIPIQEGGRIKPLDTYAQFLLLRTNGVRTARMANGHAVTPLEWLLDCMFYPEIAKNYRVFLVESPEVMNMLGLKSENDRDRFAYADLAPNRATLFQLAAQFSAEAEEEQTPQQKQVINLAHNIHDYEELTIFLDFARKRVSIAEIPTLQRLFDGRKSIRISDLVGKAHDLQQAFNAIATAGPDGAPEMEALKNLIGEVDKAAATASALTLIPPPVSSPDLQWLTPGGVIEEAFVSGETDTGQLAIITSFQTLVDTTASPSKFPPAVDSLHDAVVTIAKARGEYRAVPLEVLYYKAQFFYFALIVYVFSFLLVAILWFRPRNRLLGVTTHVAVLAATLLLVSGITLRCIIRERPPVTTLYETLLFITAVAVVVALFLEYVNRQRIALSLAAILGALGVFLAGKYEAVEGLDTMPSMIAVLDTNFWLSTHVTTVTMGYAAGLLASAIAHVYLLAALFGFRRNDPLFYRSLARMAYGVLCFGLVFSTVGTVLGGIWANNSWGRFWGWDPKENGALMIVLWVLIVLHAKVARYIDEYGVVIGSIATGMIVAFSWFGVNLLGVGLHSYGFTSGIAWALKLFYFVESIVLILGGAIWIWQLGPFRPPIQSEAPPSRA